MSYIFYTMNSKKLLELVDGRRVDKGIGIKDFASRCRISRSNYYNVMRGDQSVSVDTLIRMLDELGMELNVTLKI